MKTGKTHPPGVLANPVQPAWSIHVNPASTGSTGLMVLPIFDIKIMVWNLANLGGGFGYPMHRSDKAIDTIKRTILAYDPDVCVLLELKRTSRPPSEPRFWITRADPLIRVSEFLASDIRNLAGAILGEAEEQGHTKYGSEKVVTSRRDRGALSRRALRTPDPRDREPGDERYAKMSRAVERRIDDVFPGMHEDMQTGIVNEAIRYARQDPDHNTHVTQDAIEGWLREEYYRETREKAGPIVERKFKTFLTKPLRDQPVPIPTGAALDPNQSTGDFLKTYEVAKWSERPSKPYLAGIADPTKRSQADKAFKFADRLNNEFLEEVDDIIKRGLHDNPESLERASNLRQHWLGELQLDVSAQTRRRAAYEAQKAAWEAARVEKSHPGAADFRNICEALGTAYAGWPAIDNPTTGNSESGADHLDVAPGDLASKVVYTEGETYGILCKAGSVELRRVVRPGNFLKRAPFVFQIRKAFSVLTQNTWQDLNLIAWHAPSDSASNKAARDWNFAKFPSFTAHVASNSVPTLLGGDFNINGNDFTIRNCDLNLTPNQFFDTLTGQDGWSGRSLFGEAKTLSTLKQMPSTGLAPFSFSSAPPPPPDGVLVNGTAYQTRTSGFDRILPIGLASQPMAVREEKLVPLQFLLAKAEDLAKIEGIWEEDALGNGSTITLGNVLSDAMKDEPIQAHNHRGDLKVITDLVLRARLVSDHLPIVATYHIKANAPGSTAPQIASWTP